MRRRDRHAFRSRRRAGARIVLVAVTLVLGALPLRAQQQTPARAGDGGPLHARMRHFLQEVDGSPDHVATFFPRRGDWTWVHTAHFDGGPDRIGTWRFPGPVTRDAIKVCGPAWESFVFQPEGQPLGGLLEHVLRHGNRWRRVGGTRFVPPGESVRSPVFVEWRREDGRWVVAAFGDESFHARKLPGTVVSMVTRDTTLPLPAEEVFVSNEGWFRTNEPITFEGLRYIKYGCPRAVAPGDRAWIGRLGRVRVYSEAGALRIPEVLLLPVSAGEFQPYQTYNAPRCP